MRCLGLIKHAPHDGVAGGRVGCCFIDRCRAAGHDVNFVAHRALAKLRRRILLCLTILSLILCLATVGLWVRSHWRYDNLWYWGGDPKWSESVGVGSVRGELSI